MEEAKDERQDSNNIASTNGRNRSLWNLSKNKEVLTTTDAVKFSEEYDTVSKDNVFVYRSLSEINKILENGSGIVYLGFPECPWCKRYVVYLNEVAKDEGAEKFIIIIFLKIEK